MEINLYQSYKNHRIRRSNSKGLNGARLSGNHYRPSFNVLPSANIDNYIDQNFRSTRRDERKFRGLIRPPACPNLLYKLTSFIYSCWSSTCRAYRLINQFDSRGINFEFGETKGQLDARGIVIMPLEFASWQGKQQLDATIVCFGVNLDHWLVSRVVRTSNAAWRDNLRVIRQDVIPMEFRIIHHG